MSRYATHHLTLDSLTSHELRGLTDLFAILWRPCVLIGQQQRPFWSIILCLQQTPASLTQVLSFMAAKATIFKANLQVADMDRNHYQDHPLTIARHPSETDERMMVRLLAFALHADEHLEFGRGLSTEDEADLWKKDLTGEIDLWIDVGMPDERSIRKACGRAKQVMVYAYGARAVELWYAQSKAQFARHRNLTIVNLGVESTQALAALAQRTMSLHCMIQDGEVTLSDELNSVDVERTFLHHNTPM